MRLHRIALAKHAATREEAFSGKGGLFGRGRWHTRGQLVVYVAQHVSLAMAEALVHLQRSTDIEPYDHWEIEVPERLITAVPTSLPPGWKDNERITRAYGDAWLTARSSAALRVPSAVVPEEFNCLLNPAHPHFDLHWVKGGPSPFFFDPRLTRP